METKNPQIENGYIRIATELWEAFMRFRLSGEERQIVDAVIRKTYGYQKKIDRISFSQFSQLTGINHRGVVRAIKSLVSKKVLHSVKNDTGSSNSYCINKLYKEWGVVSKMTHPVSKMVRGSVKNGTKVVSKMTHTIDNIQKINTIDIEINPFIDLFSKVNPSYKLLFANKTQRESANRLLKKYDRDKLFRLMSKLPDIINMPYAPSITTPYELEVKMGKLLAFINQEKNKTKKGGVTIL